MPIEKTSKNIALGSQLGIDIKSIFFQRPLSELENTLLI